MKESKNHSINYYITKTCIKLFFIFADLAIINYFTTNAIITNEIAMGQMTNDNDAFIKMELYSVYKNLAEIILGLLCIWLIVPMIVSTIQYIKNKIKKN